MQQKPRPPYCEDARRPFDPDVFFHNWTLGKYTKDPGTFRNFISNCFNLSDSDSYEYKALGTTTLGLTQVAIDAKRKNGLHDWYHDENGINVQDPPTLDQIHDYCKLFTPEVSLPSALRGFRSNAKKDTLSRSIADHLASRFHNATTGLLPSNKKRLHDNPYLTFWVYSCQELEWAGPWPNSLYTKASHHILPIFYHHFGCAVPTFSALWVIAKLAQPSKPSKEPVKPILDIGSGNGYWTYLLRKLPLDSSMKELEVYPIDNGTSEYRVMWIPDTIPMSGIKFLNTYHYEGLTIDSGKNCILLLVYPQATGDFTSGILKKFQGDTIVVAGTQNENGFTGFKNQTVEGWMGEWKKEFELVLRMPLPSFAGKDEGLFVFRRGRVEGFGRELGLVSLKG
ncbi:uncharacterized protein BDR25DRAFT_283159 [Lindgomyces ingoldianus]|uniref:Uncharacterized protein n=1 Tax=Lindgomyces ingoldianus TaxID=673940 RepID=A0ACB6R089_9PLEO|nr:uncharacterized protein BDR25DRAFT_283159 [Lindgomyces ingoldianus]KAF2472663.1 hypothetical protein BDR25DRAFT_283159 [Lindgomyces ingoldianus]